MKVRSILLCGLLSLITGISYAQHPVEFVENQGQWGSWFKYRAATPGGDVLLENDGFRYVLADQDNSYKVDYFHHGQTKVLPILKFHVYKVTFEGAAKPEIEGEKPWAVYYNYFLGNDATQWKSGIHPCRDVNYNGLYNGVDMHVTSEKGNITYEFFVHPNADASEIKLKYDGQDDLKIKDHNLMISTTVGQVTEMKPYAFQYINDNKVEVPCEYKLRGNVVTYNFPSGYDHSQQLIIDPIVLLCTLTGATADNWGYSATYDEAGNFYNGGLVNTLSFGGTYPVSPGAFQTTFGGGFTGTGGVGGSPTDSTYASDIAIIKYNPTLTSRIYATYLGGSGNEHVHSMIVDPSGDLIIAGRSMSTNYPVTSGAYQPTNHGNWDMIVTKFNPTGTSLIGSTYIGGSGVDGVNFDSTEYGYGELKYNYGDDSRSEVQIDNAGNIYITGCTNSTDFPVTGTAISATLTGMQNGVVAKLNSTLSSLIWSTYIGGTSSDAGYVLAFDTAQSSVYVAGGTNSPNFPTTLGSFHPTFQGGRADGFILKFNNSAPYNLQKGTYIGTPNYDQVYGIQVSSTNQVYVMGQTLGGTFPVTPGVYTNAHSSQFIMELDSNLATDLASTVFGSGSDSTTDISPVAFLVDTCQNVYVSGWGGNLGIVGDSSGLDFGMPVTSDATMPTTVTGRNFYFIVLGSGLTSLRYATYYGRNCSAAGEEWEGDHVDGGTSRFSKQGIIYEACCANCGGVGLSYSCANQFPTTAGVWGTTDESPNCNEAALKIAFNIGPVQAIINAGPSTSGCAPLTVDFTNSSNNALSYVWNFGDGSAIDTAFAPTHTFTAGGTYTVTLSAANSNACFVTNDTAYLVITVDTNRITPGFTYTVTDSCGPYTVNITNTSTVESTGITTYQWWFGNGGVFTGATPATQSYPDTGIYTITLVMSNPNACISPDTLTQQIHIYAQYVSANFTIPDSICAGTSFIPTGGATNATGTIWLLGGGDTSTSALPTITYNTAGTDTITLIAQNPGACNGADTITQYITVLSVPTANFTFAPITPVQNTPTSFTNLSLNATRYSWDFGDHTTSTEVNPVHQYSNTGTYNVCLTAYNNSNCPSIMCKPVAADVQPELGLPSGFSPNGDGQNDVLYVRGADIVTMDLKIFNRWGQLVFETTNQSVGWDGKFNGVPQPIDAYGYVLLATFIDGTSKELKGNITLLR